MINIDFIQNYDAEIQSAFKAMSDEILHLREIIKSLRNEKFGRKSEKFPYTGPTLFDETEVLASQPVETKSNETVSDAGASKPKKTSGGRKPFSDKLERRDVVHDLPESEKVCPHDGTVLVKCGEETTEKLSVVPRQVFVERHITIKYACACCNSYLKRSSAPEEMLPKSRATPELLAALIGNKFASHLPWYRQEQMFREHDVDLDRGTMARWAIAIAEKLKPLAATLRKNILAMDVVHCDETTIQVLKEKGRKASTKSTMWVMRTPEFASHQLISFEYNSSRCGKAAKEFLQDFQGYLHVDGYAGYNSVTAGDRVVRVGCMAHARRYFADAKKSGSNKSGTLSEEGLEYFAALYKIEKYCKDFSPEERFKIRQSESKPILDSFLTWWSKAVPKAPPMSKIGEALKYLSTQWRSLIRYVEDGRLSIDNNCLETWIRPFAIGRNNWMFSDTPAGASSSALLYSLIQSARMNGVNVHRYLGWLFTEYPKTNPSEDLNRFLPCNTPQFKIKQPELNPT